MAERVRKLARLARARAERERAELACVLVHEDLDRPGGEGYTTTWQRVQEALRRELGTAHYVLAVAETEAWLLLFPKSVATLVTGWGVPRRYQGCDTGQLSDPKRIMANEVSRVGRVYREVDAPELISSAVGDGSIHQPTGRNDSWSRFLADAVECCEGHLS